MALAVAQIVPVRSAAAQRQVAQVAVTPPDAEVHVGRTIAFVATAFDHANNPIATATFVFSSSNPRVAKIDQNGIATGFNPGITIVSARVGTGSRARTGHATLQVLAGAALLRGPGCAAANREPAGSGPGAGLMVGPLRLILVRGESHPLSYSPVQSSGDPADRVCVLFSVKPGGERAVVVDSFGMVMAGGDTGRGVVQVMVPRKRWPLLHVAVEVRGDAVQFRTRELSLARGAVDTLELVVPAEGNRILNPTGMFQFVSSDTAVVRVAPLVPVVIAVAPGRARVIAQSSLYPDLTVTVSVRP